MKTEKYTASSFTDILSAQPITVISEPSSTLWIFTIAMSLSTSSIRKITQRILRQSRTLSTDTIAKLSQAPLQTATYFKSCYLKADCNFARYQTPRPTNAETQRRYKHGLTRNQEARRTNTNSARQADRTFPTYDCPV